MNHRGPGRRRLAAVWGSAALVMCLGHSGRARAGSNWKVGSFTKTTTPGNQTIAHGLGTTPRAMLFWTGSATSENFFTGYHFGLGFTDGTTSRSVAVASELGGMKSAAFRRLAALPITGVDGNGVTTSEAAFVSWDGTNVVLSWITNTATPSVVHYVAIGGSDISAKVLEWAMPAARGSQIVTGVGFKPDVVFTIHGDDVSEVLPASKRHASLGLAAMSVSGDQNAVAAFSWDSGVRSDTGSGQVTDSCLVGTTYNLLTRRASWVSMDADGFTTTFSETFGGLRVFSLALKGLNVKVGSFSKSISTAVPVSQTVTSQAFTPNLVMLYSFQDVTANGHLNQNRLGFGASDGTTHGSTAFTDEDFAANANVDSIDKASKAFLKVNNTTATLEAEATVSGFVPNGFVLDWSSNDAVATEILYVSMGSLGGGQGSPDGGGSTPDAPASTPDAAGSTTDDAQSTTDDAGGGSTDGATVDADARIALSVGCSCRLGSGQREPTSPSLAFIATVVAAAAHRRWRAGSRQKVQVVVDLVVTESEHPDTRR